MKFYFKSLVFTFFCAACLMMASAPALAYQAGDFLFRTRLISVMPNDDSGKISATGSATLGSDRGEIDLSGGEAGVGGAMTLEVDLTYMINPHFGIELVLGTTNHDLKANIFSGDGIGMKKIGTTRALPPTILAQFHFLPEGVFRPYAGIGVNYTIFYDSHVSTGVLDPDVDISNSFGLAGQAGFDLTLTEKWFFNFDVKYIKMSTTMELNQDINLEEYGLPVPVTLGLDSEVDIDIDPWVIGVGIGTLF